MPSARGLQLREGERLLKHGVANHSRAGEEAGGRLYVTDRRVVFRPHGINFDTDEWAVGVEDIEDVRASVTLWILPGGLTLVTPAGTARFLVWGQRKWADAVWAAIDGARRDRGEREG